MSLVSAAPNVLTNGRLGPKIKSSRRQNPRPNRLHPELFETARRELLRKFIVSGTSQSSIAKKWGVSRQYIEQIFVNGGAYSIDRLAREIGCKLEIHVK